MPRCLGPTSVITLLSTAAWAGTIPAALQPSSSAAELASFHASGVQIYGCGPAGKWTLEAPDAELSDAQGNRVIHHSAGPTWRATDGSKVVGKEIAETPSPSPLAVPWLLFATTATGPGLLGDVRYVQRLDTIGGVAPAGGCTAGEKKRVPYTATYTFLD